MGVAQSRGEIPRLDMSLDEWFLTREDRATDSYRDRKSQQLQKRM